MRSNVLKLLDKIDATERQTTIADKVEETFGPNPCTSLRLQTDAGDILELTCDGKRCIHCGPRKKMIIELQLIETMGKHAYIARIDSRQDLDRCIERTRKTASRRGEELYLQSVGDSSRKDGYIVVSNRPLFPGQRMQVLTDWLKRIMDLYHHSVERLRRTRNLGRVSLVTLRRKGKSGQASPWFRKSLNSQAVYAVADTDWETELLEIEEREGLTYAHPPGDALPVPW